MVGAMRRVGLKSNHDQNFLYAFKPKHISFHPDLTCGPLSQIITGAVLFFDEFICSIVDAKAAMGEYVDRCGRVSHFRTP